ncbi:putative RNA recognition motif domain, nucleotide-binding alpha-beta plait domain superfamily [Helianthus annuus]|nr:putative RNA recognition motif domain, nucleotide-binding alpha-beta plait domain superfamily [Helianthus annuus]
MEEKGPWDLPRHLRKKEKDLHRNYGAEAKEDLKADGRVTKFFITNLPSGCRHWDVADFFKVFGNVTGAYIARKPDKEGRKFGFISFINVTDVKGMERALNGTKMGGYKIFANLAKFAKENSAVSRDSKEDGGIVRPKQPQQPPVLNQPFVNIGKDEMHAFKDLIGCALVGRCKNLEILRKLDECFLEKKVSGVSLSYLGGLYMLVKFEVEASCVNFLMDHSCWKDWFSVLDPWDNQSLPFERLAWVKVQGVPMHLADNDVLNNIVENFGKIVHGSQLEAGDGNLSVSWIGLLVGEGVRIHEQVTLRWKNKQFRVWVEEEINDWVPGSVGLVEVPTDVSSSLDSRRSHESVGQVAEKAVDLNDVEATAQLNFNALNLEEAVCEEESGWWKAFTGERKCGF